MTDHTPTPWEIIEHNGCDLNVGIGRKLPEYGAIEWITGSYYLPSKIRMADFRHIIKCVNTHDELVDALKRHQRAFEWLENSLMSAQSSYDAARLDFADGLIKEEQMEYSRTRLTQAEQMVARYKELAGEDILAKLEGGAK